MRKLGELKVGEKAKVVKVQIEKMPDMGLRLMEMGFLQGAEVRILHEAPFGGCPLAIEVRGSLIALRRAEANLIEVEEAV